MFGKTNEFIHKVTRIDDSPESLARGIAIGFFIGVHIFRRMRIPPPLVLAQPLKQKKNGRRADGGRQQSPTIPFIHWTSHTIGSFHGK